MDLTLSRTGDYATRAAIALADAWDLGESRTIAQIAEEMALPRTFTPQILGLLQRAGLVEARAGRGGGYRLSRGPAQISVLEIVEAAEGTLKTERCALRDGPCRWDASCAIHSTWVAVSEGVRQRLRSTTLADLAAEDRRLARTEPARSARSGR
ncbi:MAG: RrF2 family transcriptional regulator [Actinomycetota bacterium]